MRQDFKVSDELTFLDYVNIINLLEDKKHIDNYMMESEVRGSIEYKKLVDEIALIDKLIIKLNKNRNK